MFFWGLLGPFGAFCYFSFLYLGGVCIGAIFPFAPVGLLFLNRHYGPRWLLIISYPTRARRRIVTSLIIIIIAVSIIKGVL